jgi:hypothetical protein
VDDWLGQDYLSDNVDDGRPDPDDDTGSNIRLRDDNIRVDN